jgi:hypothetical protein
MGVADDGIATPTKRVPRMTNAAAVAALRVIDPVIRTTSKVLQSPEVIDLALVQFGVESMTTSSSDITGFWASPARRWARLPPAAGSPLSGTRERTDAVASSRRSRSAASAFSVVPLESLCPLVVFVVALCVLPVPVSVSIIGSSLGQRDVVQEGPPDHGPDLLELIGGVDDRSPLARLGSGNQDHRVCERRDDERVG